MDSKQPTVFVVDDDAGALQSLCWLIQQADLPVRGFASGQEFLDSYRREQPGCLVLDVRMPKICGLEVQERLRDSGIALPIIFVTAHADVATCKEAFKGGAFDFLEKPVDQNSLIEHVRKALARDEQQRRFGSPVEFAARLKELTPREKEVLELLVAGKTLKEIAAVGNVTVQTVWRHRLSVLEKMQAANDAELIRMAALWTFEKH
jgi:two-component system, LuxR family, response regulator FixJ